jgi:hypothetical protein
VVGVVHEQSVPVAIEDLKLRAVNLFLHFHNGAHVRGLCGADDAGLVNLRQDGAVIRDELSDQQRDRGIRWDAERGLNYPLEIFFRLRLFEI